VDTCELLYTNYYMVEFQKYSGLAAIKK